jgi:hypothetical protein
MSKRPAVVITATSLDPFVTDKLDFDPQVTHPVDMKQGSETSFTTIFRSESKN